MPYQVPREHIQNDASLSNAPPEAGMYGWEGRNNQSSLPYHHHPPDDEPHVNMVHIDLFHHFSTSNYGFVNTEQQPISHLVKEVAVRHAITTPFLMHQLLALAARHRSSVYDDPNRQAFYQHLATQLQTQAISLFGRVDLNTVTPHERVSIFLFSSLLGFQDLCDALSLRAASFEVFMARYLGYVHLHRGVHKVIKGSWENLRESELRPVLAAGHVMYENCGTGPECDDLKRRIDAAEGLGDEEKEACHGAIRHLQWLFDRRPDVRTHVNVLLAWAAMFPDGFLQLLEAGRREALCVLGYYFVLLHDCKDVWFVLDAGEVLLGLLVEYLGPEWAEWMKRPEELLREPLVGEPWG
ncbi:hypothetical protein CONLIGDRAFT_647939 [Coniochaeta ligniaria NRRL 30616]|uniref:Uncharacterized protein n=1 Tax=Coniochaeta ligniaria NRRL 30616 TaxID=1408157 RepID=A0A1J7IBN7_9PEZI|nr:hypothetical protein CONLIGDRAFT_647939 [Coniochaeta ligniaria NRRL 30616]